MTLPNLPTDSLYKFTALGSLVAMLSIGFFGWSQFEYLQQRIYEYSEEMAVLRVDIDALKTKGSGGSVDTPLVLERSIEKLSAKLEYTHALYVRSKFLSAAGGFLFTLFSYLGAWSMRCWLVRVQRPQDELIRLQLEEARAKYTETASRRER